MAKPLDGIRVLDMGTFITGPQAGSLLADLGAEVIKVEMPGVGDPFRAFKGGLYSPHYQTYNRNKKSVELNTKLPEDLAARFTHRLGSLHAIFLDDGFTVHAFSRRFPAELSPQAYMDAHAANAERLAAEMPVEILAHPTLVALPLRSLPAEELWTEEREERLVTALYTAGIAFEISARYRPHERQASQWGYSLHEFLELCQEVGAEPWYVVPPTFSAADVLGLVEYLAAPADPAHPWAERRAALGQAAPWTTVFPSLHLEYGNELWGAASGSDPFFGASLLGLATSLAYWLTFNPTAAYSRWVERRYRATPA